MFNLEEELVFKKLILYVFGIVMFVNYLCVLLWIIFYIIVLMFVDILGYFDKVVNFFIK